MKMIDDKLNRNKETNLLREAVGCTESFIFVHIRVSHYPNESLRLVLDIPASIFASYKKKKERQQNSMCEFCTAFFRL